MPDLVIGGAGLFGLTIAERAATYGYKVLIVELKDHIGGNVASHIDDRNIEVHDHGSHIFHTNNETVWEYVNCFTQFKPYKHRVRTTLADGRVIPLPFSLATYSTFYGKAFTPESLKELMTTFPDKGDNFEETAIASIGVDLYENLVKGYTAKQWGCDPKYLPSSVIKRLPVRTTWDDNYFNDRYQGVPVDGYQEWMETMADNENIEIVFNTDVIGATKNIPLVYTGPLDRYFNYKFGPLGWRTIDLIEEHLDIDDFQGCAVMNYADEKVPYTRIHEYKHYHPDIQTRGTIIHKEYSRPAMFGEVGAYPINTPTDRTKLQKYRDEAKKLDGVWFGGRLGTYAYLDMHQAIASALVLWDNEIRPYLEEKNK